MHDWPAVVHKLFDFIEFLVEKVILILLFGGRFEAQKPLQLLTQPIERLFNWKVFDKVLEDDIYRLERLLSDFLIYNLKVLPALDEFTVALVFIEQGQQIVELNVDSFHWVCKAESLFSLYF